MHEHKMKGGLSNRVTNYMNGHHLNQLQLIILNYFPIRSLSKYLPRENMQLAGSGQAIVSIALIVFYLGATLLLRDNF